jgi:hypothetical protein
MDGGIQFNGYSADKYLQNPGGSKRMAGEVFLKTHGDEGWNQDFLNTHKNDPKQVDRTPALEKVREQIEARGQAA